MGKVPFLRICPGRTNDKVRMKSLGRLVKVAFQRKALLKKIIGEADIQFSESFEVDVQACLQDRS
jgi:hypothetical protein